MHSSLNMCFLNVTGLLSGGLDKTNDPPFIKSIEVYDLVFLAETQFGYNTNIKKNGPFFYHPVCRPLTKANNRYFGGLSILKKTTYKRLCEDFK